MLYHRYLLSFFALASSLLWFNAGHCRRGELSEISESVEETRGPWFTGPLLTGSSHVVPVGYFNFEPYLFVDDFYGSYDSKWHSHSTPTFIDVAPVFSLQVGVIKDVDFQISPAIFLSTHPR